MGQGTHVVLHAVVVAGDAVAGAAATGGVVVCRLTAPRHAYGDGQRSNVQSAGDYNHSAPHQDKGDGGHGEHRRHHFHHQQRKMQCRLLHPSYSQHGNKRGDAAARTSRLLDSIDLDLPRLVASSNPSISSLWISL